MGAEVRARFCEPDPPQAARSRRQVAHGKVVITISGVKHWLWRAVDQNGTVLDILVQSRRDTRAAKRLLCRLMKRQCRAPRVLITDKLASCGAARREVMPFVEHREHKGLNNRAENLYGPFRVKCSFVSRSPSWASPNIAATSRKVSAMPEAGRYAACLCVPSTR